MTPARFILLLALLGGLAIMTIDYLALRSVNGSSSEVDKVVSPPWGGYALRERAQRSASSWGANPDAATTILQQAATSYPLDSRQWLHLARIEASLHGADSILLDAHLDAAIASAPQNRPARWRAAQIALQARNYTLAELHLKRWLVVAPHSTQQALLIARRWLFDPDELLDRILPDGRDFHAQAMTLAHQQRDMALADAIWHRVADEINLDDPILLAYVEFLLDHGRFDQAATIWARHDPHYQAGGIANGDFARSLGEGRGLNWRVGTLPAGVELTRDENDYLLPPASLRLAFDGAHNVNLRTPWIRLPVAPGQRYELSGHWRARQLTTRALPSLWIQGEGGRLNEQLTVPEPSFDWTPWSMVFTVPDDAPVIRLRLRRDSTTAFDRNIAGQLWLDGLVLRVLPEEQPMLVAGSGEP